MAVTVEKTRAAGAPCCEDGVWKGRLPELPPASLARLTSHRGLWSSGPGAAADVSPVRGRRGGLRRALGLRVVVGVL